MREGADGSGQFILSVCTFSAAQKARKGRDYPPMLSPLLSPNIPQAALPPQPTSGARRSTGLHVIVPAEKCVHQAGKHAPPHPVQPTQRTPTTCGRMRRPYPMMHAPSVPDERDQEQHWPTSHRESTNAGAYVGAHAPVNPSPAPHDARCGQRVMGHVTRQEWLTR